MAERPDPIIDEIHEARREIAKRFDGDVRRISADARNRQRQEGRPVWHPEAVSDPSEPTADHVKRTR